MRSRADAVWGRQAELAVAADVCCAAEQAHDDVLAADGGDDGESDVNGAPVVAEAELAVVGPAALGQVEVGHDLEALDDAGMRGELWALLGHELPVDAQAQVQGGFVGADVDVAGAFVDGLGDDLVDGGDDRLFAGCEVDKGLAGRLGGGLGVLAGHGVGAVDEAFELACLAQHWLDLAAEQRAELVDGVQVQRVGHADGCDIVGDEQGHDLQRLGHRLGDLVGVLQVDGVVLEVGVGDLADLRTRQGDLAWRQQRLLDEHVAEALPLLDGDLAQRFDGPGGKAAFL